MENPDPLATVTPLTFCNAWARVGDLLILEHLLAYRHHVQRRVHHRRIGLGADAGVLVAVGLVVRVLRRPRTAIAAWSRPIPRRRYSWARSLPLAWPSGDGPRRADVDRWQLLLRASRRLESGESQNSQRYARQQIAKFHGGLSKIFVHARHGPATPVEQGRRRSELDECSRNAWRRRLVVNPKALAHADAGRRARRPRARPAHRLAIVGDVSNHRRDGSEFPKLRACGWRREVKWRVAIADAAQNAAFGAVVSLLLRHPAVADRAGRAIGFERRRNEAGSDIAAAEMSLRQHDGGEALHEHHKSDNAPDDRARGGLAPLVLFCSVILPTRLRMNSISIPDCIGAGDVRITDWPLTRRERRTAIRNPVFRLTSACGVKGYPESSCVIPYRTESRRRTGMARLIAKIRLL